MRIQRVDIWSVGKVISLPAGCVGLIVGIVTTVNYLLWVGHLPTISELGEIPLILHFIGGPLSVFALPIAYAVGGLIGGAFIGAVYNVMARWFGGIHVELGQDPRFFTADFE